MRKSVNWDYVAAFFDAEGHTRADHYNDRPGALRVRWQITQKNRVVLEMIAEFLVEHGYFIRMTENKSNGCGVLSVERIDDVERLLLKLQPLVIVKEDQLDDVLVEIQNRPQKGAGVFSEVKPPKHELIRMLRRHSMSEIGRRLGVSGAAVRYWCVSYEIDKHGARLTD